MDDRETSVHRNRLPVVGFFVLHTHEQEENYNTSRQCIRSCEPLPVACLNSYPPFFTAFERKHENRFFFLVFCSFLGNRLQGYLMIL